MALLRRRAWVWLAGSLAGLAASCGGGEQVLAAVPDQDAREAKLHSVEASLAAPATAAEPVAESRTVVEAAPPPSAGPGTRTSIVRATVLATDERGLPLEQFRLYVPLPQRLHLAATRAGAGERRWTSERKAGAWVLHGAGGVLEFEATIENGEEWCGEALVCALGHSPERVRLGLVAGETWTGQFALSAIEPDVWGTVRDEHGAPRAGVELVIVGDATDLYGPKEVFGSETSRETCTSDRAGAFAFRIVRRPQAHRLVADRSKFTFVELGASEIGAGMQVRLAPTARVSGRVVDGRGRATGPVRLQFRRGRSLWLEPAIVSERGEFVIAEAPTGEVSLHAWRPIAPGHWSKAAETSLALDAGEDRVIQLEVGDSP